jgi:hypothetical protein
MFKEFVLKLLTKEIWIMTADVSIMCPVRRSCFEKKKKVIQDYDGRISYFISSSVLVHELCVIGYPCGTLMYAGVAFN